MILDHPYFIPTAAAALVIFAGLLLWLRFRPTAVDVKKPLFSPEYRSFLGQLDIAVRSHLAVIPGLSVDDVLVASGAGKKLPLRFRLRKFDFVVCDRREMNVLCAIQLDRMGKTTDNSELRALCDTAGLTLLEYDAKPYRDVPTLRREVFSACGIDDMELPESDFETRKSMPGEHPENSAAELDEVEPTCPKCQSTMTRKQINKGTHAGEYAWVCDKYPECRGARMDHSTHD
ncbi:DUF2726 domain-containing protein [Endozoicomonas sp. OPT23]|uniref:DUF2726 domain-containing protein n=1 Tax=Endozoicomonas sp. OPT23 TaxID=2072845 RepID=UPI00189102A7